jgi:hypothetical protein
MGGVLLGTISIDARYLVLGPLRTQAMTFWLLSLLTACHRVSNEKLTSLSRLADRDVLIANTLSLKKLLGKSLATISTPAADAALADSPCLMLALRVAVGEALRAPTPAVRKPSTTVRTVVFGKRNSVMSGLGFGGLWEVVRIGVVLIGATLTVALIRAKAHTNHDSSFELMARSST